MTMTGNTKTVKEKTGLQSATAQQILDTVRSCLPHGRSEYALHEPLFAGNEWKYTKECLDTGWISSVGKFVDQFEAALKDYTGVAAAVAVVNGTAALHIALKLCGVERDDEVLVPSITFIATTNAVAYLSAVPHFVDSCEETLGIDPDKLEAYLAETTFKRDGYTLNRISGRRIKALIAMHALGHPVHLAKIADICARYNIEFIEDAAEALGTKFEGTHVGGVGKLATLSFNGNKVLTTGGGGAILSNDVALAKKAKYITTTAKVPHAWRFYHDETGYNYRLPNINSAVGLAQLEQLDGFLARKKQLAAKYTAAFANMPGVRFLQQPSFGESNFWLNALVLDDTASSGALLEEMLQISNSSGLQTRPLWEPMHTLPMYEKCPHMDLAKAESLRSRVLTIPSGVSLCP